MSLTRKLDVLAAADPLSWPDLVPTCPRCAGAMPLISFGTEYFEPTAQMGTRASYFCPTCALGVAFARHLGPVVGARP